MKDSIIHIIGGVGCTLIAGACIIAGGKYVSHLNDNADYALANAQSALATSSIVQSVNYQDGEIAPDTLNIGDVKYVYVDDKAHIDPKLFEELSADDTILFIYRGSVYVTEDAYTAYVHKEPNSSTSAEADTTAEGKDKKTTDNEYIVLDVDGNQIYLVEKGDTLTAVSSRISYSVDEIAEYNHIRDVNLIYAGEVLRVPVSVDDAD
jgi:LysM domain.